MTPQPPPGFRIIPPEYLEKNPLPGDGICRLRAITNDSWTESGYRYRKVPQSDIEECIYATAEPLACFTPTPDFRALCEELVEKLDALTLIVGLTAIKHEGQLQPLQEAQDAARETLTRANAALKGEK